ncbi:gamma-glutamyltransferase family protein [Halomonas saccharevitans]|uniref:Gamma-glutamyltranspeptidase / glutathione hydrolase n=1 Tax=Halomonas saccharevitans TaxID=416872 RepID=A0A1I6ZPN8_9GAMM|nr:gamma-glutamyltransferase family protein [Halomonas saccharevitans]SFT64679.1 gamma-glutamyltranspeptidase / glutathione hydrolase [Halomonas saccharevitans]
MTLPDARRRAATLLLILSPLLLAPAALGEVDFQYQRPDATPPPGAESEKAPGGPFQRFAVSAAHPLAADAGYQILAAGGSAIDAAIAVQMVLTLVEPQSSGIGGGSFLMHHDGEEARAYDGRETAPSSAKEGLFLGQDGEPLAFMKAVASGRSVGVPGTLRMLETAHGEHGRLPWAVLFEPAITLADDGFPVGSRLHASLDDTEALRDDAQASGFFFTEQGEPLAEGHRLKNPALAVILQRVAEQDSSALHTGEVARDIVGRVQNHPAIPGSLSLEDLATYTAKEREPLCSDWQDHRLCGFPPPSSGHLTVMQILGILAQLPPSKAGLEDDLPGVDWLHRFLEASRLAFADRGRYIADPAFVEAPGGDWSLMIAPDYLEERAALIEATQSLGSGGASPGTPGVVATAWAAQPTQPEAGTSHISIIDAHGNALAMTSSLGQAFGARILSGGGTGMPGGFLLNNALTDFSFTPTDDQGTPIANRVEPGKRPRSSLSPTLVVEGEGSALVASLGARGGAAIITDTALALVAMLDWGLDVEGALALPHASTLGGPVSLEAGRFPTATLEALRELGHEVEEREPTGGLHALRRTGQGFVGDTDPRREGVVRGE